MPASKRVMGLMFVALVAGIALGWAAKSVSTRPARANAGAGPPATAGASPAPIACNLDALSAEQRARHEVLLEKLMGEVLEIRDLPDGYAYRFAPQPRAVAELAEWIDLERACCPFLRFSVAVEPDGGPVWLHLTGSPQVKEFLGATFNAGS